MPEISGLPSEVFGAGALRSALPSAVRGIPGVRRFSHWADPAPAPAHNSIISPAALHRSTRMGWSIYQPASGARRGDYPNNLPEAIRAPSTMERSFLNVISGWTL